MEVWVFAILPAEEGEDEVLLGGLRGEIGGPGRILTLAAEAEPAPPGIHVGGWYEVRFDSEDGRVEVGECVDATDGRVYRFVLPLEGPAQPESPPVADGFIVVDSDPSEEEPTKKFHEKQIAQGGDQGDGGGDGGGGGGGDQPHPDQPPKMLDPEGDGDPPGEDVFHD